MKYPILLSLFCVIGFVQPQSVEARIGDTREALERRLFASGGIAFRDAGERTSRRQGGPYSRYMQYLGSSANVRVYFKTDDGRQPRQSEIADNSLGSGWEMHVLYVNGKSVLELYKRVGASTSEFEMNMLLGLLGGGGYWQKREEISSDDEDKEEASAFGFDYVRSDGEVRARRTGDGLMVFQRQLDEFLANQRESDLMERAPQSVRGF